MDQIELIEPQPTEAAPVTVEDYPYGFTRRTKAQFWVETVAKRGQRVVFRTLNPKTGRWNNPKKSTYSDILFLYRNTENGHIENTGLSFAYTRKEDLEAFLLKFPESCFSAFQKAQLVLLRAILRTREHVTVSIVSNPSEAKLREMDEREKETKQDLHKILTAYYIDEKRKAEESG